jgi:hypothetical protein
MWKKKHVVATFQVWQKLYYFSNAKIKKNKTLFQIKSRNFKKKKLTLKSKFLNKIIIRQPDAKPENVLRY